MDTMNLDQVTPLPLKFSGYVKTAMGLLLDNDISKEQLLKHLQNVCIVYACLGVKRNAGILSTEAKYAEAAKGYKEISVPGFFSWARDNGVTLLPWLIQEKMGHTMMNGAPILFNEGKTPWSRFDKAIRKMKRDYNPIWDRYVRGQPGGNLPSGQSCDDAIHNLLDGLYAKGAGTADNPVEKEDLEVPAPPIGPKDTVTEDGRGRESAAELADDGGSLSEAIIDVVGVPTLRDEKDGTEESTNNQTGGTAPHIAGKECAGSSVHDLGSEYPSRPNGWVHEYLLLYCLIGRPGSSEDPDLATARTTSGPPRRSGKRSLEAASPGGEGEESGSGSMGSNGNLDSSAIRMFTGASEIQSRAKVKKELHGVASRVEDQECLRQRLANQEVLIKAVTSLSETVVATQRLDAEAAERAREAAAPNRKSSKINNLKGQLEFILPESPPWFVLRSAILEAYQQPLSDFFTGTTTTIPGRAAGAPSQATSNVTSSPAAASVAATLPGSSSIIDIVGSARAGIGDTLI